MEARGAHIAGMAKIVPPPEWNPCKNGYDIDNMSITIPDPILQKVTGKEGCYQQSVIRSDPLTVQQYRSLTDQNQHRTPNHTDYDDLELKYWENIKNVEPIYGSDVDGSLFDDDCSEWNINRLGTILDYVKQDYCVEIGGLMTPFLYFGMWKSTFAWHTEDMDLYGINYLHFGKPKTWYAIPPQFGHAFEKLSSEYFPAKHRKCSQFLRHKKTLISPQILKQHNIPFYKVMVKNIP